MAEIKGMGVCLVSDAQGVPCSKQINEGEPIGTVLLPTGPSVAHKKCADGFYARKMQAERENRENLVKLAKQGGPGGAVDMSQAEDAIENPTPLVKPEEIKPELRTGPLLTKEIAVDPTGVAFQEALSQEPHQLTDDERAKLEEYKRGLLQARVVSPAETARKAFTEFTEQVNKLGAYVQRLATEYDRVVAERDEARSQRDSAKAISS